MEAIQNVVHENSLYREFAGEKNFYDPALLVWYEACDNMAAAHRRVAQIRAWPLRWQRQLIEATNPQWWEQTRVIYGFPRKDWYAGEVLSRGTPAHILADEKVREVYLGREFRL